MRTVLEKFRECDIGDYRRYIEGREQDFYGLDFGQVCDKIDSIREEISRRTHKEYTENCRKYGVSEELRRDFENYHGKGN